MLMYCYKYPRPALTADCIVFARKELDFRVLLVQRANEPYKGQWAFPGGFMNMDETTEETARRELKEETGLIVDDISQIGTFDRVDRDPRGRVITVAYFVVIDGIRKVKGGDDAAVARWFSIGNLPELAFDHQNIMEVAVRKLRDYGKK